MIVDNLKKQGKSACIHHIADYLKYLVTTYHGWNGVKDEYGRSLLQRKGDGSRQLRSNFWETISIHTILFLFQYFEYVIIPDVRYINEIETLSKEFESVKVRINRTMPDSALTAEQLTHVSETQLDNYSSWDMVISNDGSLDELRAISTTIL